MAAQQRIDRLERDLQLLQRQLARGESLPSAIADDVAPISDGAIDNPAQLGVRLSSMEEEMRRLRGKLEENEFQVKRVSEGLERMQKDVDFRFNELAQAKPATAPTGQPQPDAASAPAGAEGAQTLAAPASKPAKEEPASAEKDSDGFASPKEHYNHAFRLLNETKYDEAAKAFDSFTKKYPKDPLVGNAYYWQGETYYIRRDYVTSADSFRQGFEALPAGPKAADNLLKLAMSLNALKRDKEACVVLTQLISKFKKTSVSVVDKAQQEQKRIGCQ